MSVGSNIYYEYGITAGTAKRLSQDLFPLVGGTAGTTCKLGASFSGQPSGASGTYIGSAYVDGAGTDLASGAVCDSLGNIYIVGTFPTNCNITNFVVNPTGAANAGTLPVTTGNAAFIAKWNSSGIYLGAAYIDGTGSESGQWVTCDSANNVYLGGNYGPGSAAITNFGAPPSGTAGTLPATAGLTGAFIAKWDSSGTYIGSAKVDGVGPDSGRSVACDSTNSVYLAGSYGTASATITNFAVNPSGTAGTLSATAAGTGAFIAKWDSSGTYIGAAKVDGTGAELGQGAVCDGSNNVYLAGAYTTAACPITNFAVNPSGTAGTLPLPGANSAFIAKWNSGGTYIGSAFADGTGTEQGRGMMCDSSSNVYLTGNYGLGSTTVAISNFGVNPSGTAGTLPATAGGSGAFIAKWNTGGTYIGSAFVDSTGTDQGNSLTRDSTNNVYLAGQYGASAAISNFAVNPSGTAGTLPVTTGNGAFIAKWNPAGTYTGSAFVDGAGSELGLGVACDGSTNVYLAGQYGGNSAIISKFAVNPSGTAGTLPATAGLTGAFVAKWKV
jgi:hypothetical protein